MESSTRIRCQAKIEWPSRPSSDTGSSPPEVSTSTERLRRTSPGFTRSASVTRSSRVSVPEKQLSETSMTWRAGTAVRNFAMSALEIQLAAVFTEASTGSQ